MDLKLGEMISTVYQQMLEVYGDPDVAALATADFINQFLSTIEGTSDTPMAEG